MSGEIVLAGLSANDPVPNPAYVEINFAQGVSGGDGSAYEVVFLANKESSGTATPDTVVYGPDSFVPMQTEADVVALFGARSEMRRMWRRFTSINQTTTVRAIAVSESAGAAATGSIVISGTATGPGAVRIWVGDESVDAPIGVGDTLATIGASMLSAVQSKAHWPVVPSFSTATLTLTASQKGPRGNSIRYQAAIIGTNVGITVTPTADTAMTGGATADSLTAALATLKPDRYYYIVPAANDATQIGALMAQVNNQAQATTGIRQRVVVGCVDTLANAITLATGINSPRCELVWQKNSDWTPGELAAHVAAVYSLFEVKPNPRTNFCNFGTRAADQPFWQLPAPRDITAHPTRADIFAALNSGITPIGVVRKTGATYIVNKITTRSLNGSQPDYRIRPGHKVTICDFYGDDIAAVASERFGDKKMGDDVPQGTPPLGPDFVTPDRMKGTIGGVTDRYDANGLWQPGGAERMYATMVVKRSTVNPARMGIRINAEPVDNFEQGAFQIQQVA